MFEITSDIPPPAITRQPRTGRPSKYPFGDMKVGDSVWIEGDRGSLAFGALRKWKQRTPGFDYRSQVEGGGIRLWRTA